MRVKASAARGVAAAPAQAGLVGGIQERDLVGLPSPRESGRTWTRTRDLLHVRQAL
jgi:hypothetical protein